MNREQKRPDLPHRFNETAAVEACAFLMGGKPGSAMPLGRLMSMLYLVDRAKLLKTGSTLTGGHFLVMGTVPYVLEAFTGLSNEEGIWGKFFERDFAIVRLKSNPGDGSLSVGTEKIIERVIRDLHGMPSEEISKHLRSLPEMNDRNREFVIASDILRADNRSEEDIQGLIELAQCRIATQEDLVRIRAKNENRKAG